MDHYIITLHVHADHAFRRASGCLNSECLEFEFYGSWSMVMDRVTEHTGCRSFGVKPQHGYAVRRGFKTVAYS